MQKLDKKDMAILYQLELDARIPLSKIAKKVKLSKQVVKYRIDRLIKNNVIEKFVLMTNSPKLGYLAYKFYIQLQNITERQQNNLIKELNKHPYLMWIVTCDGKYDMIIAPIAKNNVHAHEIQNELLTKYKKYIKTLLPLNYIDARHQKRSYLIDEKRKDFQAPFWGNEPENYKLDKYEIKILSILCQDARKPITEVAQEIGCSVDIVHNRLKKLTKDKVIQGSRIMINKSLLGYEYHKVLLNIRFDTDEEEKKFFTFLKNESNIIDVIRMMGTWNFELDIDVRNANEFHNIMMRLKNNFSKNIQNYESLLIFKEHKYDFFPLKEKFN